MRDLTARYSLRGRLLMTATLVLVFFLSLTGLVLDQAFRQSAEQGVAERLMIHVYGLLSVTDVNDGGPVLPESLQEPGFNQLGSGLYGLLLAADGTELWRSPSALDQVFDAAMLQRFAGDLTAGSERFGQLQRPAALFFKSYKVLWQQPDDSQTPYVFVILQSMTAYNSEIRGFRNNLWGWLAGAVLVLSLLQWRVLSWGLAPLQVLAADLKAIEDGDQQSLSGNYPFELEGVTRNLNLLLTSERQQRERYRTTMGDLAHSLKTPLAILRGAASSLGFSTQSNRIETMQATVEAQVARMDEIVGYQLERAVMPAASPIKTAINVGPLVNQLVEAMGKVYHAKDIAMDVNISKASFFGDQRDMMELLGNLMDNACKYGRHKVRVTVAMMAGDSGLQLRVEDDGPGISDADRVRVLTRGQRLDTQEAGQGLGLAMVVEIVGRYGGQLSIAESDLGGAALLVSLP